jgi:YVTN family beta-propeller protein
MPLVERTIHQGAFMRYLPVIAFLLACSNGTAVETTQPATEPVLEVVVANQQSASASVLNADGLTMKHVSVGNGPHEAAVSPNGRVAVVTIYGNGPQPGNQLAVIDLVRDSVVRTISLAMYTRPHGAVFIGNSNARVAVTSESTGNVLIVEVERGEIEAVVPTEARASHMVAVTADGTRAYTANIIDDNVSELDLVNKAFLRKFAVPARPEGVAVTPDGREVWVGSNTTGAVTVISTQTGDVVRTISGITFPYRLTASPDGRTMAIVDGQGGKLVLADVASHAVVGSVQLVQPRGVQFSPDSKTAYVTLAGSQLAVVDVATRSVLRTIPVQASPDGVGVGFRR